MKPTKIVVELNIFPEKGIQNISSAKDKLTRTIKNDIPVCPYVH